jgi:hypothetical protein
MWLYFGLFGSAGVLLFSLVAWNWMKLHARLSGRMRSAARWSMIGCVSLFFAGWFACGIGGPPGNLLSAQASTHSPGAALGAAALSMFFSVPGWGCLMVGLRKARRGLAPPA